MKIKSNPPKEDPETKAQRLVAEARAEADRTSALQGLLDRRQRNLLRVFGKTDGGGGSGGSSGSSGVPASVRSSFANSGVTVGPDAFGNFDPNVAIFRY